jgi:hypothetical protein
MLVKLQYLLQVEKDIGAHKLVEYGMFVVSARVFQWLDYGFHQRPKFP